MIPKKIHFCWLSGDPYPPLIQHCIESWNLILPDYEIVVWDRNKFVMESVPWVQEAYDTKKYAFAADYIRLYALYKDGGIYLDSDVEVIGCFDALLNQPSFMGLETGGDFEPAIIGAEAGCQWIGTCLEYYKDKHFIKPDGDLDTRPLPTIVGDIMVKKYCITPIDDHEVHEYPLIGLIIYPCEFFSPKSLHTGKIDKTERTVAIHHFDGTWIVKDWKYNVKNCVHRFLIRCFGQKGHNLIINAIRGNGKI